VELETRLKDGRFLSVNISRFLSVVSHAKLTNFSRTDKMFYFSRPILAMQRSDCFSTLLMLSANKNRPTMFWTTSKHLLADFLSANKKVGQFLMTQ